jgi:colicin import membrane protein
MVDFIKQHWQYILGALLLHALFAGIFGLTMLNMQRTPPPVQLAIQAVIVDPSALNQSSKQQQQRRERERAQQRERDAQAQREREQTAEQQKREQEQTADQQRREREEVTRKETEQRAEQERQVELKQRQEADQRRQAEEQQLRERQETEKKRAAADAERKKRAEDEAKRVADIERRQKEEAERRKAADDARLQQSRESDLARQLQEEEADAAALGSPEAAQYVAMIAQAVERRWKRPLSARDDLLCQVVVRQTPAGVVLSVRIGSCNGDAAVRQSVETAVYNASPLPTPSNPRLFRPELTFNFRPGA